MAILMKQPRTPLVPTPAMLNTILDDPDLLFTDNLVRAPGGEAARVQELCMASRSPVTRSKYHLRVRDFISWCRRQGRCPVPADEETVLLYLGARSYDPQNDRAQLDGRLCPSSLRHAISAINRLQCHFGFAPIGPTYAMRDLIAGARKTSPPPQGRAPLRVEELRALGNALDRDPKRVRAIRDRAMFFLGWHAALRSAELCALSIEHLHFERDEIKVWVARSKTDPFGRGQFIPVGRGTSPQSCPVIALQDWLDIRGFAPGPLFCRVSWTGTLSLKHPLARASLWHMFRRCYRLIHLPVQEYATHSLRAGFVTSGYEHGLSEGAMLDITRHHSISTLRIYRRGISPWRENTTQLLGC